MGDKYDVAVREIEREYEQVTRTGFIHANIFRLHIGTIISFLVDIGSVLQPFQLKKHLSYLVAIFKNSSI